MGLRRIIFSFMAAAIIGGGVTASATDFTCDSKPEGTEVTCRQIIVNALHAIEVQELRLKAAQKDNRKACRGTKNKNARKSKYFKARQLKSNACIAARNTLAGTQIFQGLVQLGLAESRDRCGGCSM